MSVGVAATSSVGVGEGIGVGVASGRAQATISDAPKARMNDMLENARTALIVVVAAFRHKRGWKHTAVGKRSSSSPQCHLAPRLCN